MYVRLSVFRFNLCSVRLREGNINYCAATLASRMPPSCRMATEVSTSLHSVSCVNVVRKRKLLFSKAPAMTQIICAGVPGLL
jgi:hypothetical protein